jgi:hypothetical protein
LEPQIKGADDLGVDLVDAVTMADRQPHKGVCQAGKLLLKSPDFPAVLEPPDALDEGGKAVLDLNHVSALAKRLGVDVRQDEAGFRSPRQANLDRCPKLGLK